ncbi:MAG: ATP-binding protein [Kiritimatiellae bacterium]|nr:ATP-binding protein [Kiritimatiellia bacterium]
MEIKRDKYLRDLQVRRGNGLVKVVTGVRRAGKSYLLFNLFRNALREEGVTDDRIVEVAFDLRSSRPLRDPDALLDYLRPRLSGGGERLVLLDEVQLLRDFEEVLNELARMPGVDVYVTGSNSKFLSTDIVTEFRGRGDEVHVLPLTFGEFMQARSDGEARAWADYVEFGGLPLVAIMATPEQKSAYLKNLFEETYLADIIERHGLRKTQELEDLLNVLASATGSLTNTSKIQTTFKSVLKSDISLNTVKAYIGYLEDSFLVSAASRYDIKGRKYIGAPLKYYFEDVGLRNARVGFRQSEENHLMENVIYNELRYRGFSVDVGVVKSREYDDQGGRHPITREVDFVANLAGRRYYIQSAFAIPDAAKAEQEKASLLGIDDSFKKIVIVKDVVNVSRDEHGIVTMGLFDFLLDTDSLER